MLRGENMLCLNFIKCQKFNLKAYTSVINYVTDSNFLFRGLFRISEISIIKYLICDNNFYL